MVFPKIFMLIVLVLSAMLTGIMIGRVDYAACNDVVSTLDEFSGALGSLLTTGLLFFTVVKRKEVET